MSAEVTVNDVISRVVSNSDTLMSQAKSYADQAVSQSYLSFGQFPDPVIDPDLIPIDPTLLAPAQDLRSDYEDKYNDLFNTLRNLIPDEFNKFLTTYFPNDSCFNEVTEYLCDSIKNGGIGLPDEIVQKIWQKARDRESLQAKVIIDTAYYNAASRGFTIPPTSVDFAVMKANNDAAKNLSATNREIAIQEAEKHIEWVKFAITAIIDARRVALSSCFEYMNAIFKSTDVAHTKASGYVQAYQSFYNSLNAYYNAVSDINKVNANIAISKAQIALDNTKTSVNASIQALDARCKTTVSIAQSFGSLAASAASGVNALANIGNVTNITS